MKARIRFTLQFQLALTLVCGSFAMVQTAAAGAHVKPPRPKGPCDVYAAAGNPCVVAHSTTRALYVTYNGPLYQILRQTDGKTLDIGVIQPTASPAPDAGGYADATAQDAFCANTYCWISKIYDQSPNHNDLTQAPRGGFSGPAMGGFDNLPIADMAPVTIMGHKVYGVFIAPGMGLRKDDAKGTAVDDQAEGQYWVINGQHFNSDCCFDYGNAEIDSRDDDNGTMETTYYGDSGGWYHGNFPGPWVMTDQENNLVGCVNQDESKLCANLPSITWRFITAIAKGEPHHWTSMGGNAKEGKLAVMFDGPRINATYDPMRKQGAIVLGNGGDNSNGSQGTFYEGAITAAGTFPADSTDQLVQANIVAAHYDVSRLSLAPASAVARPPKLQTFSPGSSDDTTLTFTNASEAPVSNVTLSISVPSNRLGSHLQGASETSRSFAGPIVPGASVSATFTVTSGPEAYNGDLVGNALWTDLASGKAQSETTAEKVRNVSPIKINEFRIGSGLANPTNSFIELYNAGRQSVDISNWNLTEHTAQQAVFTPIEIPSGTKLEAGGFYLLGLSNSGLAVQAHAGDSTIHVRSVAGMSIGDTVSIDTGTQEEIRRVVKIGTPASSNTTLWQPLPDGPIITVPVGSANVPVTSTSGFEVGQKIALGYGATFPVVDRSVEQYELATVTAIGKPGTQAYLAANATAGATNIKATSVSNISVGDEIRLDIESVGHGVETVVVTRVGTQARQTNLASDASAGATNVRIRRIDGFAAGDKILIGTPANMEEVTVETIGAVSPDGTEIRIAPALTKVHIRDEWVVSPGTGLDLAAPLRFNHAANLPFSDRGTGISFQPATAFPHSSNEPVQPLGTATVLDRPLTKDHKIFAVVRDVAVTNVGYQGMPAPDQWFGGPELANNIPFFDRTITLRQGSIVLRDASGLVVDSLDYGGLVDPWAAEGYQATSGSGQGGCYAPAPGESGISWPPSTGVGMTNTSAGRFLDGVDTESNCSDFQTQTVSKLSTATTAGSINIKVDSVAGFEVGQRITIGTDLDSETASIATVGTAGATTVDMPISPGATVIPVADTIGFSLGQTITIDSGASLEKVVIVAINWRGRKTITVAAPLNHNHSSGAQVSGTGITLTASLSRAHAIGAHVYDNLPTPGASNHYSRRLP